MTFNITFCDLLSTQFTVINLRNIQYILLIYIFVWLYIVFFSYIRFGLHSEYTACRHQLDLSTVNQLPNISSLQQHFAFSVLGKDFWISVSESVQKKTLWMAGYASISCNRQLNTEVAGRCNILFLKGSINWFTKLWCHVTGFRLYCWTSVW